MAPSTYLFEANFPWQQHVLASEIYFVPKANQMKLKRILSFTGVFVLVFISGLGALILFPQPLFAHAATYQQVEIYGELPQDLHSLYKALDEAREMLTHSELFDSSYQFDVFFAHGSAFNKLDDALLGEWSAARAIDNNVIIKRAWNPKTGWVENGENHFELAYVLAHEMTHCLQAHAYGKRVFNPFRHPPMWKLEGYPEYIARRKLLREEDYNLKIEISKFLELEVSPEGIVQISETQSTPYIYLKGRLMVEYLMDIKGFSYDDILDEAVKEEAVYTEMLTWHSEP